MNNIVFQIKTKRSPCICVKGVSSQESERSCICVLGVSSQKSELSCICVVSILPFSTIILHEFDFSEFIFVLSLHRFYNIFTFFYWNDFPNF
jgi:hypothetical protein